MKVLFLTHQFPPRYIGGTELYTLGLARALIARGDRARVVTYHESPSGDPVTFVPNPGEVDGVPFVELPFNLSVAARPARSEYANLHIAGQVATILEADKPDLVHATHLMKIGAAALQPVVASGTPLVVTLTDFWSICGRHTLLRSNGRLCTGPRHAFDCMRCLRDTHGFSRPRFWPGRHFFSRTLALRAVSTGNLWPVDVVGDWLAVAARNRYVRTTLARADRIIVLSEFQKSLLIRNGIPEPVEVVPHGNPSRASLESGPPIGDGKGFVFAASPSPHKGLHIAVEAMRRVPELDVHLDIYGEGPGDDRYLADLRARSATDARIRWKGSFRPEDLPGILRGSLALVAPGLWYENNPLTVQLALALGVRVVASRLGTVKELVGADPGHLLVTADDPAALGAALRVVAGGGLVPPVRRSDLPTWESHVDRVLQIYEEVLG